MSFVLKRCLFFHLRSATTLFRFSRELRGAFRNDDSRQHARCPNVDSAPQIDRFVQRATLYADRLCGAAPLMPQPGPTVRAKSAIQRVTRVGRSRPKLGRAPRQAKRCARHDDRNAEGGGRLLPAFLAMAYIEFKRAARKLIADRAALATAARNAAARPLLSIGYLAGSFLPKPRPARG